MSQYSTSSMHAHHVDNSLLEHIRGQLGMLVSQAEQSVTAENAISQRLTFLSNQVEALRQEVSNYRLKEKVAEKRNIFTRQQKDTKD